VTTDGVPVAARGAIEREAVCDELPSSVRTTTRKLLGASGWRSSRRGDELRDDHAARLRGAALPGSGAGSPRSRGRRIACRAAPCEHPGRRRAEGRGRASRAPCRGPQKRAAVPSRSILRPCPTTSPSMSRHRPLKLAAEEVGGSPVAVIRSRWLVSWSRSTSALRGPPRSSSVRTCSEPSTAPAAREIEPEEWRSARSPSTHRRGGGARGGGSQGGTCATLDGRSAPSESIARRTFDAAAETRSIACSPLKELRPSS